MSRWKSAVPVLLALSSAETIAAPPAGASPSSQKVGELLTAYNAKDLQKFEKMLASDVRVYEIREVAQNRDQWLKRLRMEFDANWRITPLQVSADFQDIMVAEEISNFGPLQPTATRDCCWWARTAMYRLLPDRTIYEVRFLTTPYTYWESYKK